MVGMVALQEDLVYEILLRLPVKSVLKFKCVCKSWLSLITSPNFVPQHRLINSRNTNNILVNGHRDPSDEGITHILSYNTLEAVDAKSFSPTYPRRPQLVHVDNHYFTNGWIKGCCNGLLLVYEEKFEHYFLWNLATRQTKLLPPTTKNESDEKEAVGFGFDDAETNDYKVVIIHPPSHYEELRPSSPWDWFNVEVYSLKTDSWRSIETFSDTKIFASIVKSEGESRTADGVFTSTTNGMGMYSWLLKKSYRKDNKSIDRGRPNWYEVISFDMSKHGFVMTTLPDAIRVHEGKGNMNLPLLFSHSFAVVNCVGGIYPPKFDVWVLGEFGVKESWSKVFTTGPLSLHITYGVTMRHLLGFWKDNNNVFLQSYSGSLFLYDQQTMRFDDLGNCGCESKMFNYFETLVPL